MRLGVITDAHGNLPALETALSDMRGHRVDRIVHMGDAIGIGPQPREALRRLLREPALTCLMGNHEEWFAFGLPEPRPVWMRSGEVRHHAWMHGLLDEQLRAAVAGFEWQLRLDLGGVALHLAHYALDARRMPGRPSFVDSLRDPTVGDLDRLFAGVSADIICFGHDHLSHDLRGRAHYATPGPLGCSHDGTARWMLIDDGDGRVEVTWRAPAYDDAPVLAMLAERAVPAHEYIRRVFFGR